MTKAHKEADELGTTFKGSSSPRPAEDFHDFCLMVHRTISFLRRTIASKHHLLPNPSTMLLLFSRTLTRLQRPWQAYLSLLHRHPARAHAANTCVIMTFGDVIAQFCLERRSLRDYDVTRTLRFALVGGLLAGPSMHVWYRALDGWVRLRSLSACAIAKTAADQIVFLPVYLVGFVGVMGVLRGDGMERIRSKTQRDFKPMLVASYGIWPAVQLFNFYVLPLHHRILLINVVALFWNAYIGWKAERAFHHHDLPEAELS